MEIVKFPELPLQTDIATQTQDLYNSLSDLIYSTAEEEKLNLALVTGVLEVLKFDIINDNRN